MKKILTILKMLLLFSISIQIFESCNNDPDKNGLCELANEKITTQVFEGSFFPCRTDGKGREYSATASFEIDGDSTFMTLRVPDLNLDTIIPYTFWCEYYPGEPNEKIYLKFGDPGKDYVSHFNEFENSVWAWLQYENNCEMGLFQCL